MSANLASSDSFYDQINSACECFEAEWRSGGQPRIEDYVAEVPQGARRELIGELLKLEIYYRHERGDTIQPEDYESYSDHAALIATLLAERIQAKGSTEPTHAGRYRLEGLIGRGGMGHVYRAYDPNFRRPLAVKILKEEYKDRPDMAARFLDEAKITGQLQHPGVPPVHEIGTLPDNRPFLAMKLIKGRTLGELLPKRGNPADRLQAYVTIFRQVCQTLAFAHSHGVIHRDLKPANIMVGAFGEVQVMDWGLAKLRRRGDRIGHPKPQVSTGGEVHLDTLVGPTQQGAVMGTLAYMPPEQARGEVDRLDERSDVFSLGAILCVILTGQPPYRAQSAEKLLRQARNADLAEALAGLDACGADEGLVTLAQSCLSSEMTNRPPDAGAVASAVAAYQTGVQERLRGLELERETAKVRAREESKRRRVTFVMAIAVAVILVTLPLGTLVGTLWWKNEREAAEAEKQQLEDHVAMLEEQIRELNGTLRNTREKPRISSFSEARRFAGHTGQVYCIAFTPDGTLALSGGQDKTLRVWDVATGKQLRLIDTANSQVTGLTIAPDGERILFGCLGNKAVEGFHLWDLQKDKLLDRLPGGETWSNCAGFSPDGHRAIVDGHGNQLQVWDLEKRKVIGNIVSAGWITDFAVSADFRRVITFSQWRPFACLWDVETRQGLPSLHGGHTDNIGSVAISADGRLAATGSKDRTICLWDLESHKVLHNFLGHRDHVTSLTFSPDSKQILSGSSDQTVRVWDVASGGEIAQYKGHEDKITCLAISHDGCKALSGGSEGTLRMWRLKE
jgi:serine/threonine protein kinase